MSAPVFSIVCVYNDESVMKEFLLEGLKKQKPCYELITLDNRSKTFSSAAAALNHGGRQASGEYIIFVHQDVMLLQPDWLERAEALLRGLKDMGVSGVAGMIKAKAPSVMRIGTVPVDSGIWFVCHGPDKEPSLCKKDIDVPVQVQTLDEQLLLVPRETFEKLEFDEKTCPGWHLYGVDYALSCGKTGLKAYVLPLPVWHRSMGCFNTPEYYSALNAVLKKHKEEKLVFTTCGSWYTNRLLNCLCILALAVQSELGRWVGRNTYGGAPSIRRLKSLLGMKNEQR